MATGLVKRFFTMLRSESCTARPALSFCIRRPSQPLAHQRYYNSPSRPKTRQSIKSINFVLNNSIEYSSISKIVHVRYRLSSILKLYRVVQCASTKTFYPRTKEIFQLRCKSKIENELRIRPKQVDASLAQRVTNMIGHI